MWIWPFRHVWERISRYSNKALLCFGALTFALSTSYSYAQSVDNSSTTDNTAPIPLIPNHRELILQPTEEQDLTTLTLPLSSPKQGNGVDEKVIKQYFDSSNRVSATAKHLLSEDKRTLNTISEHWSMQQKQRAPIILERGSFSNTSIDATEQKTTQTKPKENGIKISLSKTKQKKSLSVSVLQEKAYHALMVGQVEVAISLYKKSLSLKPGNRLSMFGLATTYHRNGQITQARQLYAKILDKYPNDRDTLNNFLVLISDSAPQDALIELQRLEYQNSNFSPVVAHIGMLHQRMGRHQKAITYLKRAIGLSPENLSYRYNLAIIFDHSGHHQEAIMLYRQLLDAAKEGAAIPGDKQNIYDRLVYITTERGG